MAYPHKFFAMYFKDEEIECVADLEATNSEDAMEEAMDHLLEEHYVDCTKMEVFEGYCVGQWGR